MFRTQQTLLSPDKILYGAANGKAIGITILILIITIILITIAYYLYAQTTTVSYRSANLTNTNSSCILDTDCRVPNWCDQGTCKVQLEVGENCYMPNQCQTNICDENTYVCSTEGTSLASARGQKCNKTENCQQGLTCDQSICKSVDEMRRQYEVQQQQKPFSPQSIIQKPLQYLMDPGQILANPLDALGAINPMLLPQLQLIQNIPVVGNLVSEGTKIFGSIFPF